MSRQRELDDDDVKAIHQIECVENSKNTDGVKVMGLKVSQESVTAL